MDYPPLIHPKTVERKTTSMLGSYTVMLRFEGVDLHSPEEVAEYFREAFPRPEFKCCYIEGDDRVLCGRGDVLIWEGFVKSRPQIVIYDRS